MSRLGADRRFVVNLLGSMISLGVGRGRRRGALVSGLDLRLAVRMLVKYPGLTAVTVFALSIGIPASLIPMHIIGLINADLPVPQGERIIGIRNWDVVTSRQQPRVIHDLYAWRTELSSFDGIAAVMPRSFNVASGEGFPVPAPGAEITGNAFDVLRVGPLLGRVLAPADEVIGAPDVVLIGYDLWRSRLAADPETIGSTLRIGDAVHTIVGVMPQGFGFPFNEQLWIPLRANPLDYDRGDGPPLTVFGRLDDAATLETARSELAELGDRMALEYPASHANLRPELKKYTQMAIGLEPAESLPFYFLQVGGFFLLALICGNVGSLILARTATRVEEITVRTALGASRARIVGQLFIESLLVSLIAVSAGLLIADHVPAYFLDGVIFDLPFWMDIGIAPTTAFVAFGVAGLSAVVAGALPALRATRADIHGGLQRAGSGFARFGFASTALIVAQVGLTVALLSMTAELGRSLTDDRTAALGIDPTQYLWAQLVVSRLAPLDERADDYMIQYANHIAATQRGIDERLAAEPGVRGVAWGRDLPGRFHRPALLEVDGEPLAPGERGRQALRAFVDVDFFSGFDKPILRGRDFRASDAQPPRTAVIVNTEFVDRVLGGQDPVGRRVRYVSPGAEPGAWLEIVGVVGALGVSVYEPEGGAGIYHPVAAGQSNPISVAIRVAGDPVDFIPRLRELVADIDPGTMVRSPESLDAMVERRFADHRGTIALVGVSAAIAIVLSAAVLYALVSLAVSRRTREIGIRSVLGARAPGILAGVARPALLQLASGVLLGVVILVAVARIGGEEFEQAQWLVTVGATAAVTIVVGLCACLIPGLRALRVRPSEALRS